MSGDELLDTLIQRADLDALVRLVDDRTSAGDWRGLRAARDRCRAAVATGRQVWPAATLAEYRLALVAPPEWAAPMISEDAGLFTIGPLTEVIAQHHTWAALHEHLAASPGAAVVAHERVVRGERIDPETVSALPNVFDLPYELAPWEPAYALATYSDAGIDAPSPAAPAQPSGEPLLVTARRGGRGSPTPREEAGVGAPAGAAEPLDNTESVDLAVRQLVETWTASSNGRAEVSAVDGDAGDAVAALGVRAWNARPMSLAEALAWLAWAGASGGAHGRRRGAALGRFGALWVLASLLDLTDDWPVPLDRLGEQAGALGWWWFDDRAAGGHGWRLQLAIEHAGRGRAWAISAVDAG
jgi:resuscitation-promoting factor RpfA